MRVIIADLTIISYWLFKNKLRGMILIHWPAREKECSAPINRPRLTSNLHKVIDTGMLLVDYDVLVSGGPGGEYSGV